jgi:hypothetical protein
MYKTLHSLSSASFQDPAVWSGAVIVHLYGFAPDTSSNVINVGEIGPGVSPSHEKGIFVQTDKAHVLSGDRKIGSRHGEKRSLDSVIIQI